MSANYEGTLNDKIVVVTGAGRGIGKAIAKACARAGASVCCAARTLAEIEATVEEIQAVGGMGLVVQADVTDFKAVQNLFEETAKAFGGVDILFINAGVHLDRKVVEESDTKWWKETLETNLVGAYYCAKSAIPYMKKRGSGKIITIGSGMGHNGMDARSSYCCSKAGLWMLTRVLAQELWEYNISVNELIPGPVATDLVSPQSGVFKIKSEWVKKPEDVTELALFLATQPDVGPTAQSFSLKRRDY